jgi:hypothetical protein
LIDLVLSEDDLIECLQHTWSSLIEIVVQPYVKGTLLARLSYPSQAPSLCPKLEVIEFRGFGSLSLGALVDSRWESSAATENTNVPNQLVHVLGPS